MSGYFAQTEGREFVVRGDEGLRPRETGLLQELSTRFQALDNLVAARLIELEIIMVQAMLDDVVAGIVEQITNKLLVGTDGSSPDLIGILFAQEPFQLAIGHFGIGGDIWNRGEIDRQAMVEERTIKLFEAFDRSQRIGVIVAENYVAHNFSSMSCS